MRSRVSAFCRVLATMMSMAITTNVFAGSTDQPNPANNTIPANGSVQSPATQTFGGLTFGVGLALSENVQAQSRVTSAQVVNGIVRVTQTNDAIAGIVLESHYFFVPNTYFISPSIVPALDWGHGPFVAIVAGSGGNDVVTAFALGWMIGFRQPTWTTDSNGQITGKPKYSSTASWNLGIGLRVDPAVQVLGDGIVANQPLPAGETSVRYKTVPGYGLMVLSSFSF